MKTSKSPAPSALVAALASIPWCCVLPAVLALLSLGGIGLAHFWDVGIEAFLLPVSLAALGRALWLVQVRKQGSPWSRKVTWSTALVVALLWAPRMWAWWVV